MKLNKYKIVVVLICLFFKQGSLLLAQDWKADLLAMNKVYLEAKSFSMDVCVESYEKAEDTQPTVNFKGSVAKNNENYYSTIVGKTTIVNKRCKIVVDNGQKIIMYKENKNHKKVEPVGLFTLANIDSAIIFMTKDSEIKYLANNSGEKRIQIKYKNGGASKVELVIQPSTNKLVQIVYYTEKMEGDTKFLSKVIVKYSNIKLNQSVSDDLFSEKKYLDKKTGAVSLSKNYSHYELVNQSQSTPQ